MILGLKGPTWWHVSSLGRFFNSIHLWAVEIFFFTMVVHLWGKFFMGAWRGGRGAHLGHRRDRVPGRDRRRLHRLPLPAELRLAVDRQRGQGRAQLGRDRRLLQRRQLRPDVHVPRHPAAGRRGGAGGLARAAGAPPRSSAALPGEAAGREAPPRSRGRGGPANERRRPRPRDDRAPWRGPFVRYDLVKEFAVALVVVTGAGGRPHDPLLLARRPADDDPELGPGGPRRLPRHRRHRAGRDERDRRLRPALQPHPGRDPEDRPARSAERRRGAHPDRHRRRTSCSSR